MVTLLLGFVIPGFFLLNIPGKLSTNAAMVFGVVLWSTCRLAFASLRGQRRLTLMCFYVFVYAFFGVQPMLSVWTRSFPYEPYLTEDLTTFTIGLVVLGIIAFEVSYALAKRPAPAGSSSLPRSTVALRPRPVALSMLWLGILAAGGLVVLSMARYGAQIFLGVRGGGLTLSMAEGPAMSQSEWLLVIYGLRVLLASLLFISVYLWKMRKQFDWPGRSIWRLRATLILLAMVNLIVSNPLSAARLWSGSVLLTVLFIALPWKGARSYLVWFTAACLSLLLLFAGIDPRRIVAAPLLRGEQVTLASTLTTINESVGGLQTDANFDAFQMLGLTIMYTDKFGYSLGKQILLPMFFWVPRSLWPGKPNGTPDMVAESYNFFSTNVGAPLWAEGYVNLGVLGVVLLLGMFGFAARLGDDFLARTSSRAGPMFPTITSAFFAANTFILLRGDLTSGTMYLQMVVGFTFVIILLIKRHARGSATADFSRSGTTPSRPAPPVGRNSTGDRNLGSTPILP
jgi:hypothetical protein